MATLKFKEIKKMSKEEKGNKLKELKMEMVKARANATKTGGSKIKEIKKIVAKILTSNSENGNMS